MNTVSGCWMQASSLPGSRGPAVQIRHLRAPWAHALVYVNLITPVLSSGHLLRVTPRAKLVGVPEILAVDCLSVTSAACRRTSWNSATRQTPALPCRNVPLHSLSPQHEGKTTLYKWNTCWESCMSFKYFKLYVFNMYCRGLTPLPIDKTAKKKKRIYDEIWIFFLFQSPSLQIAASWFLAPFRISSHSDTHTLATHTGTHLASFYSLFIPTLGLSSHALNSQQHPKFVNFEFLPVE